MNLDNARNAPILYPGPLDGGDATNHIRSRFSPVTTESEDHARLVRTVEEWARLAKQPPTPARRARLAQLEREKQRLAALYRQQV